MTRTEFYQGAIRIAFGLEHATGYFLSVTDTRLQRYSGDGEAFNRPCGDISAAGKGIYLQVHTGILGFASTRVDMACMKELWRLYGVSEDRIKELDEAKASH